MTGAFLMSKVSSLPAKPGPSLTQLCYCHLKSKELLLLVIKLRVQGLDEVYIYLPAMWGGCPTIEVLLVVP